MESEGEDLDASSDTLVIETETTKSKTTVSTDDIPF
jgi:hypothetical protein